MVKLNQGGKYLSVKTAERGEKVKFNNAGEWRQNTKFTYEDGTPKNELIFQVHHNGEDKELKVNKASQINLSEAWGDDTEAWVGKTSKINIMPTPNGQHKMIVLEPTEEATGWDE